MRHARGGNKLSRQRSWRKATVRDIAKATLINQRISTTKAKAKEGRRLVERLITLGKKGTLTARRQAFSVLCDHQVVSDLFNKTAPRFKNRIGGYTRIIPYFNRRGDNAQMVFLELTEIEIMQPKPKPVQTEDAAKKKAKVVKTQVSVVEKDETKKAETKKIEEKKPSVKLETPKSEIKKVEPPRGGFLGFKNLFKKKQDRGK